MKYILSKYTRIISCENEDNLIIFNSFNGNQSYIFDPQIKEQINVLKKEAVDEEKINKALRDKYCVQLGTDEYKIVIDAIYSRINDENNLNIIIIPTTECNFRCEYCYEEKECGFIEEKTLENLYKSIKRHFSSLPGDKSLRLDWFGGEPLLYYDKILSFCSLINNYCVENSILFQHSITTNGYLLSQDKAVNLINCGINLFQITIDGVSETHDKYRHLCNGSPTWQKIIDNLIELKSISSAFKVLVRINYNMEIAENLDEFYSFFKSVFEQDNRFEITFHAIGHWGGNNDNNVDIISPEYQSYMMYALTKNGIECGITQFTTYIPRCGAELCYANMRRSYVVYKNGLIGKCTLVEAPDCESDFVIGDINNGYFRIDENKERKWIYPYNEYDKHIKINRCSNCISFPICGGISCPAYRIKNGDYTKKCTPTTHCIDDLVRLNYDIMLEKQKNEKKV